MATEQPKRCLAIMPHPDDAPVVLVVDDEAILRWHATETLADHGYRILEADDAATALRILEERPEVRLLFTDIQMPGLDGLALAQKVHERCRMSCCS